MPPPSRGRFVANPGSSTGQSMYGPTAPKELRGVHIVWLQLNHLPQGPGVPHGSLPAHAHAFCPRTPKHAMADTPPDLTERWDRDTRPGLEAQNWSQHAGQRAQTLLFSRPGRSRFPLKKISRLHLMAKPCPSDCSQTEQRRDQLPPVYTSDLEPFPIAQG